MTDEGAVPHEQVTDDPRGLTTPGVDRVRRERLRQLTQEGYTPSHDAGHDLGQLSLAGSSYAYHAFRQAINAESLDRNQGPLQWPWDQGCWKPSDDPIRNLEKAGALIAAEIDRLLNRG